jgi:hypothetical protein
MIRWLQGAPPPDAPQITLPGSSSPLPPSALVGMKGHGRYLGRAYTWTGAYHPPTGTAWAFKVRACGL